MIASISATFGLSIDKSFLNTTVGSINNGAGGTLKGRSIAASLLKMLPAGTVVGGTIAAATAATLTTAFGGVYITTLVKLFVKNNGEPPTSEEVAEAFKKEYSKLTITKQFPAS